MTGVPKARNVPELERLREACRLYRQALSEARDCCGCGDGWEAEQAAHRLSGGPVECVVCNGVGRVANYAANRSGLVLVVCDVCAGTGKARGDA